MDYEVVEEEELPVCVAAVVVDKTVLAVLHDYRSAEEYVHKVDQGSEIDTLKSLRTRIRWSCRWSPGTWEVITSTIGTWRLWTPTR